MIAIRHLSLVLFADRRAWSGHAEHEGAEPLPGDGVYGGAVSDVPVRRRRYGGWAMTPPCPRSARGGLRVWVPAFLAGRLTVQETE